MSQQSDFHTFLPSKTMNRMKIAKFFRAKLRRRKWRRRRLIDKSDVLTYAKQMINSQLSSAVDTVADIDYYFSFWMAKKKLTWDFVTL